MLQKSPREERFGCLFGLLGGTVGLLIGARMHDSEVESVRIAEPDAVVDFLPVMPVAGLVLGGLIAALFGMVLSRLLPLGKSAA